MARLRVPLPSRLPAARDPLSFSRTRCVRSSDTEHGASKRVEAERDLAALAPLTAGNRVAESVLSAHKASRQCTERGPGQAVRARHPGDRALAGRRDDHRTIDRVSQVRGEGCRAYPHDSGKPIS